MRQPAEAEALLSEFAAHRAFVGVRALTHTYDDPDWILLAGDGLDMLAQTGLTFDVVTGNARGLRHVATLGERHPELRIVLDHLGKPPISGTPDDRLAWRSLIAPAAQNPSVSAKLSGLFASAGPTDSWTVDQLRPFVADALELFGPNRLMYGGDWPLSTLSGGYSRSFRAISELVDELAPEHRNAIFGNSAASIYRLYPRPQEAV